MNGDTREFSDHEFRRSLDWIPISTSFYCQFTNSAVNRYFGFCQTSRIEYSLTFIHVHLRSSHDLVINRKWTGIHVNSVIMSSAQLGLNPDLDEFLLSVRELESKKREYFYVSVLKPRTNANKRESHEHFIGVHWRIFISTSVIQLKHGATARLIQL